MFVHGVKRIHLSVRVALFIPSTRSLYPLGSKLMGYDTPGYPPHYQFHTLPRRDCEIRATVSVNCMRPSPHSNTDRSPSSVEEVRCGRSIGVNSSRFGRSFVQAASSHIQRVRIIS